LGTVKGKKNVALSEEKSETKAGGWGLKIAYNPSSGEPFYFFSLHERGGRGESGGGIKGESVVS